MPRPSYNNLSDSEIVAMIQNGSSGTEFSILYKRYYPKVLDKCYGMLKDRMLAEELAEDILTKAFEKLPSLRKQSNFSSWLYAITYNHCIDYLREKHKMHYPNWNARNEFDWNDWGPACILLTYTCLFCNL
jgi:RNA polymerase sigma-70 factor (ECF subfamily)